MFKKAGHIALVWEGNFKPSRNQVTIGFSGHQVIRSPWNF